MQAYLELKISWELFKKVPAALNPAEQAKLHKISVHQARIEALVLGAPEAAGVMVPWPAVEARLKEIQSRYPDRDEFLADMRAHHLSESSLVDAINRDLRLETVLERVSATAGMVSEVEAEIYFRLHPAAFQRPEMRRIQHILMTFDSPGEKARVQATLNALIPALTDHESFAALALKHSQCPSALEGGVIGLVKPGQLYPELETVAFALQAGQVSAPTESPMGWHLLRCDAIEPGETLTFAAVRERIIERLGEARRQAAQKAWIQALLQAAGNRQAA